MKETNVENIVSPRTPPKNSRAWLDFLHPDFKSRNFWIAQLLVIALVAVHDITDRLGMLSLLGSLYFISIALFFIPLVFVALNYRPVVAVITGFWVVLLTVPDWAFWPRSWDEQLSELLLMVLMTVLAAFISRGINREKTARGQAVRSEAALRASEIKYRNLFESSPVPVIILNTDGKIEETNPAANELFAITAPSGKTEHLSGLIGQNNAAKLLGSGRNARGNFETFSIRNTDGTKVFLKPTLSFQAAGQESVIQVILRDVTEEHDRHVNLKAYTAAVTEAREEERRHIALAIHDDSIQPLILLCRQLDNSAKLGEAGDPALLRELSGARKTVEDLVSKLREFITSLRPPALDDFGVVTVIRSLIREYRDRSHMNIELNISGDYQRLAPDIELGIFRIAQEAISNAVLHSQGSHITVNLTFSPEDVKLEVTDNGTGFTMPPANKLTSSNHFGIIGMQERADMFGGIISIESVPGKGTKVTASVQLKQKEDSKL